MDIIPGIFEKDPNEIVRKITLVSPFVQWIHITIADELLISKTPAFFSFLQKTKSSSFEAHLVAEKPEISVKHLIDVGFKRIIAPVECMDPREFLSEARVYECETGLAIDVETPLEEVEPFLEELDFVLIMTAGSGPGDHLFEEAALSKIKTITRNLPDLPIEVEGGITPDTVKLVIDAGAARIVSSSYIFKDESRVKESIETLRKTY